MINRIPTTRPVMLIAATLLLGACATGQPVIGSSSPDQKSVVESPNTLQISDIPLPAGAKFDTDNSLIIGSNDSWLGRVVIKTDVSPLQTFNHFYNGMPASSWTLVTAVQSRISSMTYMRGERVATLQIEPSSLGGAMVAITVSTRQAPAREAAPAKPR